MTWGVVLLLAGCSAEAATAPVGAPPSTQVLSSATPTTGTASPAPERAPARSRGPQCPEQFASDFGDVDVTRGGTFFPDPPDAGLLCRYPAPTGVQDSGTLLGQQELSAEEAIRIAELTDQGKQLDTLPAGCPSAQADVVVGLFVMPTDAVVRVRYSLEKCFGLAISTDASRQVTDELRDTLIDLTGATSPTT